MLRYDYFATSHPQPVATPPPPPWGNYNFGGARKVEMVAPIKLDNRLLLAQRVNSFSFLRVA